MQNYYVFHTTSIIEILGANGWVPLDVGSSRRQDYNTSFLLFKRSRKLSDILLHTAQPNDGISDDIFKRSSAEDTTGIGILYISKQKEVEFQQNIEFFGTIHADEPAGSFPAMGTPISTFAPDPGELDADSGELRLSRFDDFQSLCALRSSEDSLVIGFDSEWYGDETRKMLSWQFALIHGKELLEYVFLKRDFVTAPASKDLWLEIALARILDDLDSPSYKRIRTGSAVEYQYIYDVHPESGAFIEKTTNSWETANNEGRYAYVHGQPTGIPIAALEDDISGFDFNDADWSACKRKRKKGNCSDIQITLVAHATKVDITTLHQKGAYRKEVLRYLTEAGGGVFSMRPIYLDANSVSPSGAWNYYYPIVLHIRDSLCSAPAGNGSLSALGKAIGIPKVKLPDGCKEHMDTLLLENPSLYMDYASRDAVIAMLYTSAVYGINKRQAVTILSAGANVLKTAIASYLGLHSKTDFDRVYRGLQTVSHGMVRNQNRPGFIEARSLEPLNRYAGILQNDASQAYQGGYNSCSDVGFYDVETYDYDLQNAYPSAMCLVPDVD